MKRQPRLIVEYRGCAIFRNTSPGYALRWQTTCNGLRLAADTLAGVKALIRETLESDKIMGAM